MSILDKAHKKEVININSFIDHDTVLIAIENAPSVYGCVKIPKAWENHHGPTCGGTKKGFVIAKAYELLDVEDLSWLMNHQYAAETIINTLKIKGTKKGKTLYFNIRKFQARKWENGGIQTQEEWTYLIAVSSKPVDPREQIGGFYISFKASSPILQEVENMEVKSYNVF